MNLAIFVSGSGTNCENIIKYFQDSDKVHVTVVISNRADAYALVRAERLGVPTEIVPKKQLNDEAFLMPLLRKYNVEFVVLAGFLLLAPDFLIDAFPRRIINLHPALLPKFGGKGMWGHHVHEAVHAAHEKRSGITIHFVNPELDEGEHIAQFSVALDPADTPDDIADKVHELEMKHFPSVIDQVIKKKIL